MDVATGVQYLERLEHARALLKRLLVYSFVLFLDLFKPWVMSERQNVQQADEGRTREQSCTELQCCWLDGLRGFPNDEDSHLSRQGLELGLYLAGLLGESGPFVE